MPATGPIPPEVGKCFTGEGRNYGRDLISSGPYMVKGEDGIDATSCATIKPTDGYDGADGTHITIVRNPNYAQSTDKYRKNLPDEFDFTIDSNADDIFQKVQAGDLDDEISQPPPKTIRAVRDGSEPQVASVPERRRPHQLHHDEPDPAAVRRHPRAQGDEPDHRQGEPAEGMGRLGRRLDRDAQSPDPMLATRSRATTPTRRPARPASVAKPRRR